MYDSDIKYHWKDHQPLHVFSGSCSRGGHASRGGFSSLLLSFEEETTIEVLIKGGHIEEDGL